MKRLVRASSEYVGASAVVRPVTFGDYGVYITYGTNSATLVFEGTQEECYDYIDKNYK